MEEDIKRDIINKKMKRKILGTIICTILVTSCASIPKETVVLSKTIGADLQVLHNSHRETIQILYGKIKMNINTFVDDVYAPFVIHYVLQTELEKYKEGASSIFGIIETAGKIGGKSETEEALNVMLEFQEAANTDITTMRNDLLQPVLLQEREMLNAIDISYQNTIYANASLTAYLTSLRRVKDSQSEALSIVGLNGIDVTLANKLVELSGLVDIALDKGKKIDIKSDEAYQQINDIVNKIRNLTNEK